MMVQRPQQSLHSLTPPTSPRRSGEVGFTSLTSLDEEQIAFIESLFSISERVSSACFTDATQNLIQNETSVQTIWKQTNKQFNGRARADTQFLQFVIRTLFRDNLVKDFKTLCPISYEKTRERNGGPAKCIDFLKGKAKEYFTENFKITEDFYNKYEVVFFSLVFHDKSYQKVVPECFSDDQSYLDNKKFIYQLRELGAKTPKVEDLVDFYNHPVIQMLWWNP